MISLRLRDEEYREIKDRCGDLGSASMSEFVRAAMLRALGSPTFLSSSIELNLVQFAHRIDRLDARIQALEQHVRSQVPD